MKTELTEEQKAEKRKQAEIKRRPGKFATKVRNHMKKEGLRSGVMLVEYWEKPNPSPMSLEKIGIPQDVIVMKIKQEIEEYKSNLPA